MTRISYIFLVPFILSLAACASVPTPTQRALEAQNLASTGQMMPNTIKTDPFDLMSFQPADPQGEQAIIYIEGDGYGWVNASTLSSDPTPITQTLLELAAADKRPAVYYLARPCQFVGGLSARNCTNHLWDETRYSGRVVNAMSQAIDQIKDRSGATSIGLVGHSGGGVIALLLAAQRYDVEWIVTVASPIDVNAFTRLHRISTFTRASNPATFVNKLADIPQHHYFGRNDEGVPASIGRSYMNALPNRHCSKLTIIRSADHNKGWAAAWPQLIQTKPSCVQ